MPSTETAFEHEARRHQVAALLTEGSSQQTEIAEQIGVSYSTVKRVKKAYAQGGIAALATKPHGGSQPRMTAAQGQELLQLLSRGATAFGYDSDWWNCSRINQLIADKFGIQYHTRHIGRVLKKLGWSRQLPKVQAPQRDEAAIEQWRKQDWPRLKKKQNVAKS
jgi:transposase